MTDAELAMLNLPERIDLLAYCLSKPNSLSRAEIIYFQHAIQESQKVLVNLNGYAINLADWVPPGHTCTCKSILNGHENGCPFVK